MSVLIGTLLILMLAGSGDRKTEKKPRDDRDWIDWIEETDAMLED